MSGSITWPSESPLTMLALHWPQRLGGLLLCTRSVSSFATGVFVRSVGEAGIRVWCDGGYGWPCYKPCQCGQTR